MDAEIRPEYVLLPERYLDCAHRYYCFQAAQHAILNMKNKTSNGPEAEEALYGQEKIFYSEIMTTSPRKTGLDIHLGRRFLYKLRTDQFSPY